jgi:hypothetical protein
MLVPFAGNRLTIGAIGLNLRNGRFLADSTGGFCMGAFATDAEENEGIPESLAVRTGGAFSAVSSPNHKSHW